MCQPEAFDDSWLAVRAGSTTLLNLNDCFLNSENELTRVRRQVGPIDILLTQFSFAAWAGNRGDEATAKKAARESRERILQHTKLLEPRVVVPSASFVWFCHRENHHLNASMNRVSDIARLLEQETNARPVVLYPGDTWSLDSEEDPTPAAMDRYAADYQSVAERPVISTQPVSTSSLIRQAEAFRRSLRKFHGIPLRLAALVGLLPATTVWLKDHQRAVAFSMSGLVPVDTAYADCDIAMVSSALALLFANFWSGMTLIISGRFEVPSGGELQVGGPPMTFRRYVMLADDANHGWHLRDELLLRLRMRLVSRARSVWPSRHTPSHARPS
jgi:hypothetical protein